MNAFCCANVSYLQSDYLNYERYASVVEMKWYVVYNGRVPGVYDDWSLCNQQVVGFSKSSYKSFKTKHEAAEGCYSGYCCKEVTNQC